MPKAKKDVVIKVCFISSFIVALLVATLVYLDFGAFPEIQTEQMERPGEAIKYNIDETGISGNIIYINGWAAKVDEDILTVNCAVLLKDRFTGVTRKMKTEMVHRAGISEALESENDIENCGFTGYVRSSKLNDSEYQVCIWYGNNNHNILIETDTYINAGGVTIEIE